MKSPELERRKDRGTYAGKHDAELKVEPVDKAGQKAASADDDDVLKEARADVDIARRQGLVDKLRDRHHVAVDARIGRRRRCELRGSRRHGL
jgi:hypothetical protein